MQMTFDWLRKLVSGDRTVRAVPAEVTGMAEAEKLLDSGEVTTAEHRVHKLLKTVPESVAAHSFLGRLCLQQQRYDEAQVHLEKAVELAAKDAELNMQLSLLYMAVGQYPEARKQLEKLAAILPGSFEVYLYLGQVCSKMERYFELIGKSIWPILGHHLLYKGPVRWVHALGT